MSKQTAEETLRQHAVTLGVSMRDLRQLVLQCFIDDENFLKRQHEALQNQVNSKQIKLMDLEISNRGMEQVLLQGKLSRMVRRKRFFEKLNPFKKSK
ncbi:MAG: hypothetical protein WCO84_09435 [bacterium]